jgi:hypothetical protein
MLASLLPIAALLSLTAQAAEPPKDPLLEQRRSNLPKTLPWPTSFFQPQIAVPGAPRSTFRLAAPGKRTLSAATLAEAEAYAAEQKSTALLIYQGGELQHMWFAPGTNADTISHTYNMQYTPLVLLVGMRWRKARSNRSTSLPRATCPSGGTILVRRSRSATCFSRMPAWS